MKSIVPIALVVIGGIIVGANLISAAPYAYHHPDGFWWAWSIVVFYGVLFICAGASLLEDQLRHR